MLIPLHSEYLCLLFTTAVFLIFERSVRRRNSRRKRGNKSIRRNAIRVYGRFRVLSEDLSLSFRCNLRFAAAPVHRDIFKENLRSFLEVVHSYCTTNVQQMFRALHTRCSIMYAFFIAQKLGRFLRYRILSWQHFAWQCNIKYKSQWQKVATLMIDTTRRSQTNIC